MNINISKPKLKFKKIKMKFLDNFKDINLENIDYEKMQKENLKKKRNTPYETTHYKTVKEFFYKSVKEFPDNKCILEKPDHKTPYKTFTYSE